MLNPIGALKLIMQIKVKSAHIKIGQDKRLSSVSVV